MYSIMDSGDPCSNRFPGELMLSRSAPKHLELRSRMLQTIVSLLKHEEEEEEEEVVVEGWMA